MMGQISSLLKLFGHGQVQRPGVLLDKPPSSFSTLLYDVSLDCVHFKEQLIDLVTIYVDICECICHLQYEYVYNCNGCDIMCWIYADVWWGIGWIGIYIYYSYCLCSL